MPVAVQLRLMSTMRWSANEHDKDGLGRTIVSAALVARSLGLGFSARGVGGGRAAVCGAEASRSRVEADVDGITTGGESAKGSCWFAGRYADIMARRVKAVEACCLVVCRSANMAGIKVAGL